MKTKPARESLFWTIADFFRERPVMGWRCLWGELHFDTRRTFTAAGRRWNYNGWIGFDSCVGARASILILPADLLRCGNARLTPPAWKWFEQVVRRIRKLGYRGLWDRGSGRVRDARADLEKRLRNRSDVEREALALSALDLTGEVRQ